MARYIKLGSCGTCPHRGHKGGFGAVAYIPVCRKANRELPWEPKGDRNGRVTATASDQIPDWCPLPVLPDPSGVWAERAAGTRHPGDEA